MSKAIKKRIHQRWPGSQIRGESVYLKCGCIFPLADIITALEKK